jgi:hypothetical protein
MNRNLSIGSKKTFEIMSADTPPEIQDNDRCVIAFVPFEGIQMCKYYNGSKTWKSMMTLRTVEVTTWLKLVE